MGGSSSGEVQIPLPQSEKSRVRPEELTDVEVEQAIVPLFDYFDANLPTLNTYLSDSAKVMVMSRAWKEMLGIIEGLLIPPLSDSSSEMKLLSEKEVDIVFRWLKFLRDYFYANGEGPVPLESIQNQRYRDVLSIQLYYDWHSDALMEEYVRGMQQSLGANSTFIICEEACQEPGPWIHKETWALWEKKERKQKKEVAGSEDVILRILRMSIEPPDHARDVL
ncbi:Munc13 (mammalian uncoordinated) homology domain containing protein [Amanita muscaria]